MGSAAWRLRSWVGAVGAAAIMACASSEPPSVQETAPQQEALDPCGGAAMQELFKALREGPAEQRASLVREREAQCRDRRPELTELLNKLNEVVVVDVARSGSGAGTRPAQPQVALALRTDGVYLDGALVEGSGGEGWKEPVREALKRRMAGFDSATPQLLIAADREQPYQRLVELLDLAREVGFVELSLATVAE